MEYYKQDFHDIVDDNNISGKEMAEMLGLKHGSYRVALTKDVMPKWMRIGIVFYQLGFKAGKRSNEVEIDQ